MKKKVVATSQNNRLRNNRKLKQRMAIYRGQANELAIYPTNLRATEEGTWPVGKENPKV